MIASWLRPILEARGAWNADGVGRAARATTCRACGAFVLRGLDADRAALPVVVDPVPLNELGEFAALLAGRKTYETSGSNQRCELNPRNPDRIGACPATARSRTIVLVEHHCGRPMAAEGRRLLAENAKVDDDRCPF
jgi:hypothetical protein